MNWFENLNPVIQAFLATTFTWAITALGALVVCFFKEVNKKVLNTILGFSAGVMIAASFWSLLSPAIDLSNELGYIAWVLPAIGFIIGSLFVLLSDKLLDKTLKNRGNLKKSNSLKKSILLISAMTIHNIPEGMAVGETHGRYQGEIVAFSKLIRAGKLTIREAADMTGMTEKVFLREMEKIENYSSPQIQPLLSTPH